MTLRRVPHVLVLLLVLVGVPLSFRAAGDHAARCRTCIGEAPLPHPASTPLGLTRGPNGNLRFTGPFANRIGRLAPGGRVTELPLSAKATASAVTAYVQALLAPRVVVLEAAVAQATRAIRRVCGTVDTPDLSCTIGSGDHAPYAAASTLLMQLAAMLTAMSGEIPRLPVVGGTVQANMEMAYLREDIAACADRLAETLHDAAVDLRTPGVPENAGGTPHSVAYGPQIVRLLGLLRRAEGWLETVDHETGAWVRLPGFAPGAPPIETQLGLQ
jgi:hypothetical protein